MNGSEWFFFCFVLIFFALENLVLSESGILTRIKEKERTANLCDRPSARARIHQKTDSGTIMGSSWPGSKESSLTAQGFPNIKGKINGTEMKMEISLCAYLELLKILVI